EQLQGFAAPAELWESETLPRRVRDYRPSWLDEALSAGGWTWRAEADRRGEPRVAIVPRDFAGPWPPRDDPPAPSDDQSKVRAHLDRRGASFVRDIAREAALPPSRVYGALHSLLRRGAATNDRFDPLRPGAADPAEALARAAAETGRPGRPR